MGGSQLGGVGGWVGGLQPAIFPSPHPILSLCLITLPPQCSTMHPIWPRVSQHLVIRKAQDRRCALWMLYWTHYHCPTDLIQRCCDLLTSGGQIFLWLVLASSFCRSDFEDLIELENKNTQCKSYKYFDDKTVGFHNLQLWECLWWFFRLHQRKKGGETQWGSGQIFW